MGSGRGIGMARALYRNLAWVGLGVLLGVMPNLLVGLPVGSWLHAAAPALVKPAEAAEPTAFTDAAFQAARQAGKPILVHISASWCPTCAQQRPILDKLEHSAELGDLTVFTVDFDSQK